MAKKSAQIDALVPETVSIDSLTPHARNYKSHPVDQITQLAESIRLHGMYRNIVIARDGTILAGHGVVLAARSLGMGSVLAVRLDIDANDPRALKLVIGDNEIAHLAERDDRMLADLLREIAADSPAELLGTGYDAAMLANLAMITRPASEIPDFDAAAEWAGLPSYEPEKEWALSLRFKSESSRDEAAALLGLKLTGLKTYWYPAVERSVLTSMNVEGTGG